MPLRIQTVGACVVVALPPVVDNAHIAEVNAPLQVRVWDSVPPPRTVILDLSPVQFIDTPGVALINWAHRRGRERGIGVRVVAPTPSQRRILDMLGVDRAVVFRTMHQALVGGR